MSTPPIPSYVATAAVVAAVVTCYRFGVSPAVRALARYPTPLAVTAAVTVIAPLSLRPSPLPGPLHCFVVSMIALLTWRGTTSDYDVTLPIGPQRRDKLLLLFLAVTSCLWAPALLAWIAVFCGMLRGWQHHAMMPVRLLKVYLAWFLVTAVLAPPTSHSTAGLVLVLGCVSLSHYVKPAWSKARLGPRPWSWAWNNRTHYLVASAYSWGWARFLPSRTVSRLLRRAGVVDRPVNLLTMVVEAAGLVAFLDRRLLIAILVATALFNLVVALASGIIFWENIAANIGLATAFGLLPETGYDTAFGWPAALVALTVMLLSTADLLWQPWHLGWWDAPFTARIHWQVETVSGATRGLYNDYMCPYEREFGRVEGYFLTDEPVLHGHLGIVWDQRLRDLLVQARGDQDRLHQLKQTYGRTHRNEERSAEHVAFLTSMFTGLNAGTRKSPLPRWLRHLKAPGGQLYRWGDLPAYHGEEPVRRITMRYEERCYLPETGDFVLLADRVVREIDLSAPMTNLEDNTTCARSSSTAAPTSESC
ncbi:hypothetical protein QCN29_11375 [Streptomyces sp. HNM0663]|uniref:Uncharacterized protein n=1 Tax=Streptomyces chengmaiensis TaxID=3040919 RepID=A0ABT6HKX6_9ACTN|nr:hypothetical protein [Streptomyces chengmaiensis]MDH2389382.1 hypothetical protein [Streptomyces chengmaiensis]